MVIARNESLAARSWHGIQVPGVSLFPPFLVHFSINIAPIFAAGLSRGMPLPDSFQVHTPQGDHTRSDFNTTPSKHAVSQNEALGLVAFLETWCQICE
jgi:hypothetical protein